MSLLFIITNEYVLSMCRLSSRELESRGNNLNYEPNANITNIKNVNTTAIWTTLVQCWLTPLSVLLE
jgi:hypothetical protein